MYLYILTAVIAFVVFLRSVFVSYFSVIVIVTVIVLYAMFIL